MAVAARYRGNYLGSVSLPTQQATSYSAAPVDKPKREGGTPDELPGQALDPNREPPVGSLEKKGGGTPSKVCTWHQHRVPAKFLEKLQLVRGLCCTCLIEVNKTQCASKTWSAGQLCVAAESVL